MELTCAACQAFVQIPDERVPVNVAFRVACPRCRQKITASTIHSNTPPQRAKLPLSTLRSSEIIAQSSETADEVQIEVTDHPTSSQPTALIYLQDEDTRAHIQSGLESMGYKVDCPGTPDQAWQRLHYNAHHIMFLDDPAGNASSKRLAHSLLTLDMNTRRDLLLVLIGSRFRTADHWQAFVESVDLVIHPADLMRVSIITERCIRDHGQFYRIFNECLAAAGKKILSC